MYYMLTSTDQDIKHHGILGQKWGKRNGPPYPLDGSDHSASENKAGWRKSLSNSSGNGIKGKRGNRKSNVLKKAKREDINELSTKELNDYNNRLQAEQNFKRLTESNGKRFVKNYSKQIAAAVITPIVILKGKQLLEKSGSLTNVLKSGISVLSTVGKVKRYISI